MTLEVKRAASCASMEIISHTAEIEKSLHNHIVNQSFSVDSINYIIIRGLEILF